jgi:hypothetical protein
MHSTNLSSGLSSSANRSKNCKPNSHFNNINPSTNLNKSNGNGNYSTMNRDPLNGTPTSNGNINLGAQLISSQLKGNSSAMNDYKGKFFLYIFFLRFLRSAFFLDFF